MQSENNITAVPVPEVAVVKKRGNPFKPGHPRFGGRKPGQPNKRTVEVRETCERLNFHPVAFLAEIAATGKMPNPDGTSSDVTQEMRLDAAKSCAPYVAPKLNAIQVAGPGGGPIQVEALPVADIITRRPEMLEALQDLAFLIAENQDEEEGVKVIEGEVI